MLQLSVLYEVIGVFWEIDPYNALLTILYSFYVDKILSSSAKTALFDPKNAIIGAYLTLFFILYLSISITYLGPTLLILVPFDLLILIR